jgi:hypothetical protein
MRKLFVFSPCAIFLFVFAHCFVFDDPASFLFNAVNTDFSDLSCFHYSGSDDFKVVVAADKVNVLFAGIDNPVSWAACSLNQEDLLLCSLDDEVEILDKNNAAFIVRVKRPGSVNLIIKNKKTGKTRKMPFRVARIPDPVLKLSERPLTQNSVCLKIQNGIYATVENFDFNCRCAIQSYNFYFTQKNNGTVEYKGTGGPFVNSISRAVRSAKPGDFMAFTNVKVRCPGDVVSREIRGLSFKFN